MTRRRGKGGGPPDFTVDEIVDRLTRDAEGVLAALGFNEKGRRAQRWAVKDLSGAPGDKLCVWLTGPRRGFWKNFTGPVGGYNGGNLLHLIIAWQGGQRGDKEAFKAGLSKAKTILGLADLDANGVRAEKDRSAALEEERRKREEAAAAFRAAHRRDDAKTYASISDLARDNLHARRYFEARGIDAGLIPRAFKIATRPYWAETKDAPIHMGFYPVIVAPLIDSATWPARVLTTLHMTFLDPHEARKVALVHPKTGEALPAKKYTHSPSGGVVTVQQPARDRLGPTLALTEGIENAMTVAMRRPDWSVWCLTAIHNFSEMTVPRCIETLVICEDGDSKPAKGPDGEVLRHADGAPIVPAVEAIDDCADRWSEHFQNSGSFLRVLRAPAPAGQDYNSLLTASGPTGTGLAGSSGA